ncbi:MULTISPECIES: serine/threonine-protein kinase [unclassified Microcoleus]|uniref:serine/threonine-protein kinase n=1 Tax=unclassified Microcoleus TaxID=2642155 RepID=UPI0025F05973|nr:MULTISPECIES: serine/threonine-protein kinase [unclassified Microcoleus]
MQGSILAGRYHIIKHLGGGGFGQTYLAEDKRRSGNLRCVVKQLKPQFTDPQTLSIARRLFKTETESLHQLGTHSQIPELLDHFEENQEFYLVQELIDGRDLSKEIIPGQRLSESEVMAILHEIIEILVFVQQHKVIHRDIKPTNLMRRNSDRKIFLIDFGAVKQITTQIVNTTGQIPPTIGIGTGGYMPAEQNNGHPNFSSDIYAVGMTGIEWLTGILPHELPKDANGEIVWRDRARVSDGFANILNKMVRYHFRDRYQSAAEVLQALNNLRRVRPPTTVISSPNLLTLMSNWTREHIIGLLGVSLAAIFGVAAFFTPEIRKMLGLEGADNLASYDNTAKGIKMKYPDNWTKQEESNAITQEVVQFISPKESEGDKFQERLIVTVEPTTNNKTLDEYTKLSKQEILKLDKNAKIDKEEESTLAGKNGYRVVYTTKEGNEEFKKLNVWTMKNDKAYLITYEAEAGKYKQFLPVVEKMIKSLEVQDTK